MVTIGIPYNSSHSTYIYMKVPKYVEILSLMILNCITTRKFYKIGQIQHFYAFVSKSFFRRTVVQLKSILKPLKVSSIVLSYIWNQVKCFWLKRSFLSSQKIVSLTPNVKIEIAWSRMAGAMMKTMTRQRMKLKQNLSDLEEETEEGQRERQGNRVWFFFKL